METIKKLIEQYQCTGCVSGCDTDCGEFKLRNEYGSQCLAHVSGTFGAGRIYLGIPRGMNKVGDFKESSKDTRIRIWVDGNKPEWDALNLPVWCKQDGDNLIVKTVTPRRGEIYTDIIQNATKEIITIDEVNGIQTNMETIDITEHDWID